MSYPLHPLFVEHAHDKNGTATVWLGCCNTECCKPTACPLVRSLHSAWSAAYCAWLPCKGAEAGKYSRVNVDDDTIYLFQTLSVCVSNCIQKLLRKSVQISLLEKHHAQKKTPQKHTPHQPNTPPTCTVVVASPYACLSLKYCCLAPSHCTSASTCTTACWFLSMQCNGVRHDPPHHRTALQQHLTAANDR